jgi:hypothetical protein
MRRNVRPEASQANKRHGQVLVSPLNFRAEASKTRQTVQSSPALSANLFLHVVLGTRLFCIMTFMEYCLQAATLSADSQRGGDTPGLLAQNCKRAYLQLYRTCIALSGRVQRHL